MNIAIDANASRLKAPSLAFEDRAIVYIIADCEIRVRTMCRAMQVCCHADETGDLPDQDDLLTLFKTFYEFVDQQMDQFTRLRECLDHGLPSLSISELRQIEALKPAPLPRSVFRSKRGIKDDPDHAFGNSCGQEGN